MVGVVFLLSILSKTIIVGFCTHSNDPNLRSIVHRALDVPTGSGNLSQSTQHCRDHAQCDTVVGICEYEDRELVNLLCPIKCGACVCEDSLSTGGNCSSMMPDICMGELAPVLCAKSCHRCGPAEDVEVTEAPCVDYVSDLTCEDLDNPCSDPVGQLICPRHCGVCGDVVTEGAVTTTMASVCPPPWMTVNKIGCHPAEIVFLLEYDCNDSPYDVYWEGSFIRELIAKWPVSPDFIRIGLVVYHDSINETISLTDFHDKTALDDRIGELTPSLQPGGSANLAAALNFTRHHSFTDARPDVEKIVIPIVHEMNPSTHGDIVTEAAALKNDCITIIGLIVNSPTIDYTVVSHLVSRPVDQFFLNYRNFFELESGAKDFDSARC